MNYQKGSLFYEGKAKKLYEVSGHSDLIWVEYKDSLTAFNAQKLGSFKDKGALNHKISSLIFERLEKKGVPTHRVSEVSATEEIIRKLEMVKLELVLRNVLAGSTAKKLGIPEGASLKAPLIEFYFKDDALADPFVSTDQALVVGAIQNREEAQELQRFVLKVNEVLNEMMKAAQITLVDFKIEAGRDAAGKLYLGDEISPDCMRLWDMKTGEKMDKDRFRRDLGGVEEAYREVLARLAKI